MIETARGIFERERGLLQGGGTGLLEAVHVRDLPDVDPAEGLVTEEQV